MTDNGNTKQTRKSRPTVNAEAKKEAYEMVANAIFSRTQLLAQLIDQGGKDINKDCGYPTTISPNEYQMMYEREGIATRAVDVWPKESWSIPPEIYEVEDPETETEFETAWNILLARHSLFSVLARADKLSGIGQYGIILLGIDDGLPLSEPVDGFVGDVEGGTRRSSQRGQLLYARPFAESALTISSVNQDPSNPRFGMPDHYSILFDNGMHSSFSAVVHWHRIVHIADNREMSDVFGTPRMRNFYNRLLDVRKILGGSGEMFWKGGFPGYSLEVIPGDEAREIDASSMRTEMQNYMLGLQRYMAFEGMTVKSLTPQAVDPEHHLDAQLNAIALSLGIPKRILFGSEQAELASSQDTRTWNRRLRNRQTEYITPMVIRPFVDRLIGLGVLPQPAEYTVDWPDLDAQTDDEKAAVARVWAEAFAKYVGGDVANAVPLEEFLSIFGGLDPQEIAQITKALDAQIAEEEALGEGEEDDDSGEGEGDREFEEDDAE